MIDKQNIRIGFLFVMVVIGILLFNSWQTDRQSKAQLVQAQQIVSQQQSDIPSALINEAANTNNAVTPVTSQTLATINPDRLVTVKTDVYNIKIDLLGGDIVYLDLPEYPVSLEDQNQGFTLLNESKDRFYIIQSGLLNETGPDSTALGRQVYSIDRNTKVMEGDESILNVDMHYRTYQGVNIIKRYIFTRGSYEIRIQYIINNHSGSTYTVSPYGRIKRTAPIAEKTGMFGTMRTYTGAAVNTPDKKYKKVSFADMQKAPFQEEVKGGWAAMVEHYFVSAIVPSPEETNYYKTDDFGSDTFGITFITAAKEIPAGHQEILETKVYAGPEIGAQLKHVAPGLDLTIDYGFLWFLCQPIFWLLKTIHDLIGNWGVAIILTTVIIKALFYKLSESSYKSMGNMRKMQPKIEALKKRYPDDKQQFSQAMMELYRKEKVNPLGGCLPILIQIPVFIALYYVLLESVDLRQAPFMLWIHDLSAKDPFYVLPIIMGISMFVQQRLNPAPPDPMQAKVLMFMPLFFTFLFLQFPAGLVLYWVVNNLLSIAQQWLIMRRIEKSGK